MRTSQATWIWLALIISGMLGIYLPALDNVPVYDDQLLVSGQLFREFGSLLDFKPRMLSYGSFVWVQDLVGDGWWKQRLVNLAIHVAVVAALWAFYNELLRGIDAVAGTAVRDRSSPAMGLALGMFALNPVAVYAVAYLIQRSVLMATLFVVLGLWAVARGLREGGWGWFAVAVIAYAAAVASKEHAVMAPIAAVPVLVLVARPGRRRLAYVGLACTLLLAATAILFSVHYGEIIGKPFDEYSKIYLEQLADMGPDVEENAYLLSIINQSYLFLKYGWQWLVPWGGWMSINLRPPFPVSVVGLPHILGVAGYLGIIAGGIFLLLRYRDLRALAGLSLLLPAILFVTEFSTVWVQDPYVLYRSYLWAIGLPGLILASFHGLPGRVILVLGVVLGGLFGLQAFERGYSLGTPLRVWNDAIAKLPDDERAVGRWFPYLNRAAIRLDDNRLEEAFRDFSASSRLGDHGMGMSNIGAMLGMVGKYAESLAALDKAREQGFEGVALDYQRGVALYGLGRYGEAYDAFAGAWNKVPPEGIRVRLQVAMARTAAAVGNLDAARVHFDQAIAIDPGNQAVRDERAAVLRGVPR